MRWIRKICSSVACATLVFFVPFFVEAHATPTLYEPSASASVSETPKEISIRFSERIEKDSSGINVFAPNGLAIHAGVLRKDTSDERLYHMPIDDGGEGIYTVAWQVVSVDDGHFTKGSYQFMVSKDGNVFSGTAGASVEVQYVTKLPEALVGTLGLIGESIFLGALIVLLFVYRRGMSMQNSTDADPLHEAFVRNASRLVWLGGALLSAGTLGYIIQKTLDLASIRGASFADALSLFLGTAGGEAASAKMLLALFFLALFYFRRKTIFSLVGFIPENYVLLASAAGIIYFQAKVSHATASFFMPNMSVVLTALHLFFKEMLAGGIIALVVLGAVFFQKENKKHILYFHALYARIASIAILVGGTTGAYICWLHLKRFDNLLGTEWGVRFLALLFFGALFFFVRALNQLVLEPRTQREPQSFGRLRFALLLECMLGAVVLFYSAYISITTPPFLGEAYSFEKVTQNGGLVVALTVHPFETGKFLLSFADADGTPIDIEKVVATAKSDEHNIGASVLDTEKRSTGRFVFERTTLAPHGVWNLNVTGIRAGSYDTTGEFEFSYPADVDNTRYSDEARVYDSFARFMLWCGMLILLAALTLFALSARRVQKLTNMEDIIVAYEQSSFKGLLLGAILVGLVLVFLFSQSIGFFNEFARVCTRDGNEWVSGVPTRDASSVSKNARLGCSVHGGHYIFMDKAEYDYFKTTSEVNNDPRLTT